MADLVRGSNESAPWDRFTADYYKQYDTVLPVDNALARAAIGCLSLYDIPLGSLSRGADVCNGGVARWPAVIAPYFAKNSKLEWIEYGEPQVQYARKTIAAARIGELGRWSVHEADLGKLHPSWKGAISRACELSAAVKGSIFDLLPESYELASTWFGPESITSDPLEYEEALRKFLTSIEIGGIGLVASMYGSTGWDSAGVDLPAISIGPENVLNIAENMHFTDLQSYEIRTSHQTVRPENGAFEYGSMGLVVGKRIA
jgi:hypothetical protein